jgi:hypothetical protein
MARCHRHDSEAGTSGKREATVHWRCAPRVTVTSNGLLSLSSSTAQEEPSHKTKVTGLNPSARCDFRGDGRLGCDRASRSLATSTALSSVQSAHDWNHAAANKGPGFNGCRAQSADSRHTSPRAERQVKGRAEALFTPCCAMCTATLNRDLPADEVHAPETLIHLRFSHGRSRNEPLLSKYSSSSGAALAPWERTDRRALGVLAWPAHAHFDISHDLTASSPGFSGRARFQK